MQNEPNSESLQHGTSKGWPCRKLSQSQAGLSGKRVAQTALQPDGATRKLPADEPKTRLQLVDCDSLTSDGFVRPSAIEPNPATKPRFRHLEKGLAAFWKSSKEDLQRKGNPEGKRPEVMAQDLDSPGSRK